MKRSKTLEHRKEDAIRDKEGLLKDVETLAELKMQPLVHHKEVLLEADNLGLRYPESDTWLFQNLKLELRKGERVFLHGSNGCGKSTLIKAVLKAVGYGKGAADHFWNFQEQGRLTLASGLVISYVSQDTSYLNGSIRKFCEKRGLEESLFCAEVCSVHEGTTQEVLVESICDHDPSMVTGRLSNNLLVHFHGDASLIGKLLPVHLTECKGFYYLGEPGM